jgi:hypothetical protein
MALSTRAHLPEAACRSILTSDMTAHPRFQEYALRTLLFLTIQNPCPFCVEPFSRGVERHGFCSGKVGYIRRDDTPCRIKKAVFSQGIARAIKDELKR